MKRSPIKRRAKRHPASKAEIAYMLWIKTQPCIVCTEMERVQTSPTEVAHVGSRGMAQKCSGFETVPLCALEHHREGRMSVHKLGRHFWTFWGIDKSLAMTQCMTLFLESVPSSFRGC